MELVFSFYNFTHRVPRPTSLGKIYISSLPTLCITRDTGACFQVSTLTVILILIEFCSQFSVMASNAIVECISSSSHAVKTYDVFVSFHGEDTRNNFTGFLFHALRRNGIEVFKDDADLRKGESIAPELLQAIEASHIFIVVFSKHYASSTWCLRELAKICNCIETSHKCVLPIFYDVDPSEVRKQSGYYEEAFAKHEEMFKQDKEKMEEVQTWRKSLTQVANLSGWDIRNKPQHDEIEEIVRNIINILGSKFSSLPNDNLVGMESRLEELAKLLHLDSDNDTRVVGICGMAGIGKTTLGRALYERISHQYDFRCFIDDVNKIYRDSSTLGVQKHLLSHSQIEKNVEICNVSMGTCLVWSRLRNAKALIVFDNVDKVEQLKIFTGNRETLLRECLGGGSRIIIISRDKHILRTHGVDDVYHVQPLNDEHAVQLLCRNAFKGNYIMSDFEILIHDLLIHAQGHPLAIEVLGSSLFGRNVSQWKSALGRLREKKSKNIMDVLRISFDELEDMDKEIFLDIACLFYRGEYQEYLKEILDFRGFHPEIGLQVLSDKSLITIEDGRIYMQNLLSDLGKCIVREKYPKEPRNWSRLWDYEDLHKVMLDDKPAENLEAIVVDYLFEVSQIATMRADALSKMSHLKFLKLGGGVKFSGSLNYLSNQLGYLIWEEYPFQCLPPCFQPEQLVQLSLRESNIKQLWEGKKPLHNLKRLDLSYSQNLIDTPNFGEALNLEILCLEGCTQLRQMDPSIGLLRKLTFLNLTDCKSLVCLPNNILELNSLEFLSLSGCSKLYNILSLNKAKEGEHSKKLCIRDAPMNSHSTWSIMKSWFISPLQLLYSKAHKDSITCLPPSSLTFPCMRHLDLCFCNLLHVPDAIGNLHFLETLRLMGNNFATLPSLKELSKLNELDLQHCKRLKYLPELPSQTNVLSVCYWQSRSFQKGFLLHLVEAVLKIFNCPELVERERCSSMCFSWMMQIVQANYPYECGENCCWLWPPHISSIIPGSEIPRWFNNQYEGKGNFIYIDTSHFMHHDKNWIGVACSVIFVIPKQRGICPLEKEQKSIMSLRLHYRVDLITDELDHMFLFYFNRKHFIRACTLDHPLRTYPGDLKLGFQIGENECYVEVKKYGYRLLYKEDLQQNSLFRKRKCEAIERT